MKVGGDSVRDTALSALPGTVKMEAGWGGERGGKGLVASMIEGEVTIESKGWREADVSSFWVTKAEEPRESLPTDPSKDESSGFIASKLRSCSRKFCWTEVFAEEMPPMVESSLEESVTSSSNLVDLGLIGGGG